MSKYFPKPNSLGANVKFELDLSKHATKTDLKNAAELDLSKHATKTDLKNAAGVDTSFAKKVDLANLKSDVDKLGIDKFKNIPSGLAV